MAIRSVAIIGAGPSGLAAAKYLLAERAFDRIRIFEQRARVGGVWDYDSTPKSAFRKTATASRSDGLDRPIWTTRDGANHLTNGHGTEPTFLSPLYDKLETNIPRSLMGFSDLDWPEDAQLFPKHETVTEYIERYAGSIRHLIAFQTQVVDIRPVEVKPSAQIRWSVKTQRVVQERDDEAPVDEEIYDAVIIASGHFNIPFTADLSGLKAWKEQHPNTVSHSMHYQDPEDFRNKKVLVIGNGPSGMDIASQISTTCSHPLLHSSRSESFLLSADKDTKLDVPNVSSFDSSTRTVTFVDGHSEESIDAILFCTGYRYAFPFLHLPSNLPPLIETGDHVLNTYKHLFYRPEPSLAFPVLQQRVIPFPMAEAQAAVLAKVWSGKLSLPSEAVMEEWERSTIEETGAGRAFHCFKFPGDGEYINEMADWTASAVQRGVNGHTANGHDEGGARGKTPPRWTEKDFWLRERFPLVKKAFAEQGEKRHAITTVEELGFDFEAYKRERDMEDRGLI